MFSWKTIDGLAAALMLSMTVSSAAWSQTIAAPAAPVPQDHLNAAASDPNNFLHTNGNYAQTRYFPGKQINTSNVGKLRAAWIFQTEVQEVLATTPIIANGVMYVTTAFNHVYALNAKTGEEYWHYKHAMAPVTTSCCGPINRGVAVYDDKVYMATVDAKLVALDAKTGGVRVADRDRRLFARLRRDDGAHCGRWQNPDRHQWGEYGIRGFVRAYDAETGKLIWNFNTIPEDSVGVWATLDATGRDMHRDIAAEKAQLAKTGDPYKTLGGPVWQNPAVDLQTKRIYFSVGNPSPGLDGSIDPATISTRSRWCRLISIPANMSATFNTSLTMCGTSTQRARRSWLMLRTTTAKSFPASSGPARSGKSTFTTARTVASFVSPKPWWLRTTCGRLPTREGTRMLPGMFGGVASPMAVDPLLGLTYALNIHRPTTYHIESTPYPGGQAMDGWHVEGNPR